MENVIKETQMLYPVKHTIKMRKKQDNKPQSANYANTKDSLHI